MKHFKATLVFAFLMVSAQAASAATVTGHSFDSAANARADARKSAEALCWHEDKEYEEIRMEVENNGGSWTAVLTYRCV